jgi:hypothetical protein
MMKWFIRKRLAAFERKFGYDASYMRHVLDTDISAFMRFGRAASSLSGYRKDVPIDLHAAVGLTGTLVADCGPCTQLGVTMALQQGVPAATIAKIIRGDETEMTATTRLGARFARAVLARSAMADDLRAEIEQKYGPRAVISLGLTLVASQLYPTFKYAIGYGHACRRIEVGDQVITPTLHPVAAA